MAIKDHPIISFIARTGFITKGIVYFTIGVIMVRSSLGISQGTTNTQEVLVLYSNQKFGFILLSVCGLGLLAHAAWRLIQAVLDPEEREPGLETKVFRGIGFLTGILYLTLSFTAFQILTGRQISSGSGESAQVWVSRVLELPYGQWLVFILAGICVFGGFYQFYSAVTANFDYNFDRSEMTEGQQHFLRLLGRIGIAAWGIVYNMVGVLMYQAAVYFNAEQAGGMEKALQTLAEQPYGLWALGITSAGLLIYGIYLLVLARFHKIYGHKGL